MMLGQKTKERNKFMKWLAWWLLLLMMFATGHIAYNSTASEPIGFYWIKGETMVKRGDLVLLKEPLKRIVGMPGDHIRSNQDGVRINDTLILDSYVPLHSPYTPFYGELTLAPGQYWVLGDHPLSWDSRYIGPIPESLIASTVEPAWTPWTLIK